MSQFDGPKGDLVELAREVGWREAITRQYGNAEYITDERRGIFLDLLPLEGADVLEIGPGFGQFTDRIARQARSAR